MGKWAIYKISCLNNEVKDFYIGCSTVYKKRRKQHLKSVVRLDSNSQFVHYFIHSNGGWDEWTIDVIDNCKKVKTRECLFNLERRYIERYQPSLNMTITSIENRSDSSKDYLFNNFLSKRSIIRKCYKIHDSDIKLTSKKEKINKLSLELFNNFSNKKSNEHVRTFSLKTLLPFAQSYLIYKYENVLLRYFEDYINKLFKTKDKRDINCVCSV